MSERLPSVQPLAGAGSASTPSGGWRLTKWQLALAIGIPLAAASLAGTALLLYAWKRRREPAREAPEEISRSQSVSSEGGPATIDAQPTPAVTVKQQSTLEEARAIKQRGNELYKEQKFEEAIKCYEQAIQVCPEEHKTDVAVFHQNLAAVHDALAGRTDDKDLQTSHLGEVIQHCTEALVLDPRYVKALTRRLKASEFFGRKKEALMDVTRVLLLDESQGKALARTVARLLKEIGQEMADANFLKLGPLAPTKYHIKTYMESFMWEDDISEAQLKKLWTSSVASPKPPDGHLSNGAPPDAAQEQEAEKPESVQSEASAESHDQDDQWEGFNEEPFVRAAAMLRKRECKGIIDVLSDAIHNGRAVFVPHARLMRGSMYSLWRQEDQAMADLEDVVSTRGLAKELYTNALVKKATIHAGQFQHDKCKACFEKALVIDPRCADVYAHRARVGLDTEEPQAFLSVLDDLERALKMAPESPFILYSLASTYHRIAGASQSMQQLELARVKFDEAVKKFPNYVDGLILYSLFLQDLNEFQKAEEILNKAAQLDPDNPLAHFSLGLLSLVFRQDSDSALRSLEAAIGVDVSCVQAYETLASLEMQRGNKDRALELYEKGIQYSRTKAEMAQAYIACEIVTSQEAACQEYGITTSDLAARSVPGLQ